MASHNRHSRFAAVVMGSAFALLATYAQAAPTSHATQVLADRPIGYWRLGERMGTPTAADSSLNGNDGSYMNGITLEQPGFHGGDTAALFDGRTGRIVVQNSATDNPARITMEAKIRRDGRTGDLQQRILEKESFAGTTQYRLSVMPRGKLHVELRARGALTIPTMLAESTDTVALGAETHVAATYDGDQHLYLPEWQSGQRRMQKNKRYSGRH